MAHDFDFLVSEACAPQSDLPVKFIGLLLYAQDYADQSDIQSFLEWLGEEPMWFMVNASITNPSDHFECAEGKTWDEMEKYYLANRPKHTEPHW